MKIFHYSLIGVSILLVLLTLMSCGSGPGTPGNALNLVNSSPTAATYTPTNTPTTGNQPTSTYTHTPTVTATVTATATMTVTTKPDLAAWFSDYGYDIYEWPTEDEVIIHLTTTASASDIWDFEILEEDNPGIPEVHSVLYGFSPTPIPPISTTHDPIAVVWNGPWGGDGNVCTLDLYFPTSTYFDSHPIIRVHVTGTSGHINLGYLDVPYEPLGKGTK